jgi:ATP synthase protein I
MAQILVGAALVLVVWLWFRQVGLMWSALYGVTSVVVPGSLLARGVARGNSGTNMATAVLSFVLWEFVKIGAAVAMLVAAPKVVPDLSWPALLVAMIVCMKVNWLVLLWRRRPMMAETKQRV